MKLVVLIGGLILSTIALLSSVVYRNNSLFLVSDVLALLAVLLTRELATHRWYQPFWLGWWGASLLGSGWLEHSEGLPMSPVSTSFGPGFLIMAVLSIFWPKWFNRRIDS